MTLQELADYFKVSKSCLNHRMRRLMSLSAGVDKAENKEEK
jgi:DNA-binding transcriptional regulator WhiA